MKEVTLDIDDIRIFLHVLAVSVWVGGQIVLGAIVPVLRRSGDLELPKKVARQFARVSWPAFVVAVVTGIWSVFEQPSDLDSSYHMTLGIKVLLVLVSGLAAGIHSATPSPALKGATGGIGLAAAVGALFAGVLLAG
jgi:putative copper export protein